MQQQGNNTTDDNSVSFHSLSKLSIPSSSFLYSTARQTPLSTGNTKQGNMEHTEEHTGGSSYNEMRNKG